MSASRLTKLVLPTLLLTLAARLADVVNNADIELVFENLKNGSRNHSCARSSGAWKTKATPISRSI